ncbi:SoxR reducing system RseC family protein [Williamwhitmania taraxaci]|nr:SoxR reducing system RseC family protein [Williamwhitmania taraxaci]
MAKDCVFTMGSAREKTVEHLGRVVEVTRNSVRISIVSASACGSCHAKSACSLSESTEKDIVVDNHGLQLHVDDQVKVILQRSLAMRAVVFGYVLPLFVMLGVLIAASELLGSEIMAGLWSIGAVVVYYLMLNVFKKRLEAKFVFRVERLD